MATFPTTLSDPSPGLQGHGNFEVEYRKTQLLLHKRNLCLTDGMTLLGDLDCTYGTGSPGQRVSWSAIWVRVGSGRIRGQSPDPAFWPGFLFNVVKNCRQTVSFIIIMRYRGHWHVSHKTSSQNFCIKINVARKPDRTDHCPAVIYLFTDPFN